MSKDSIVWICCILLVFVGILIGQAPLGTDFFKAPNIHDFFDIVGVIATCAAVVVAASGLNTWKSQVKSTADHELARRMAIALERYKTKLDTVLTDAKAAAYLVESDEYPETKLADIVRENFSSGLSDLSSAGGELKAIALECKAIWGDIIETDLNQLFMFASICSQCVNSFLRIISPTSNQIAAAVAKDSFSRNWKKIDVGPSSNSIQSFSHVEQFFSAILSKLSLKLLR